jgi:hypothetical protein
MIWLASLVTEVAFELPVIVQTPPCSVTSAALAESVMMAPVSCELVAVSSVAPDDKPMRKARSLALPDTRR